MKIPFMNLLDSNSKVKKEILRNIEEIIDNSQFINGPQIATFEKNFAEYCSIKHVTGCSNGTDAIALGLKALGVQSGDAILVPANSFIATAEAVSSVGAIPYFVDVEPDLYTISPEKIESFIFNNRDIDVKVVIPVHLYGQMANMPAIVELARKYNFKILEDSAQAHGSLLNGKGPGYYGDIATFSFYPGKNLGAFGDAGAVITNNLYFHDRVRMLINHGRKKGRKYEHDLVGSNNRIDTIQAAILDSKLKYLTEWNNQRKEKALNYLDLLKKFKNISCPIIRKGADPVWHLFVVRVKNRDKILEKMKDRGISCGIHYPIPLHLLKAYEDLRYSEGDFPLSEEYAKTILSLPLWPEITEEQQRFIIDQLEP